MIEAYSKIKPRKIAERDMQYYCTKADCGGFIIDGTGDVKLNYNACVKYAKMHNHKTTIGQIVAIISHEYIHYLLYDNFNNEANKNWDNIAMQLEHEEYLGGE
jgi:predicted SprT family Zn-dependent metalloprotease